MFHNSPHILPACFILGYGCSTCTFKVHHSALTLLSCAQLTQYLRSSSTQKRFKRPIAVTAALLFWQKYAFQGRGRWEGRTVLLWYRTALSEEQKGATASLSSVRLLSSMLSQSASAGALQALLGSFTNTSQDFQTSCEPPSHPYIMY